MLHPLLLTQCSWSEHQANDLNQKSISNEASILLLTMSCVSLLMRVSDLANACSVTSTQANQLTTEMTHACENGKITFPAYLNLAKHLTQSRENLSSFLQYLPKLNQNISLLHQKAAALTLEQTSILNEFTQKRADWDQKVDRANKGLIAIKKTTIELKRQHKELHTQYSIGVQGVNNDKLSVNQMSNFVRKEGSSEKRKISGGTRDFSKRRRLNA